MQLIDDLLEKKNYRDLMKTAEDRNVWRTIRRDCHEPALQSDNWMTMVTTDNVCHVLAQNHYSSLRHYPILSFKFWSEQSLPM